LVRDLRATGAVNVAGGRRRGLTGRRRWQGFEQRLLPPAGGRLAVTVELILGHAWGRGPIPARPAGITEIRVPVGRIRRPSETT
jgi:malonyl-CoA O-methyltransferase